MKTDKWFSVWVYAAHDGHKVSWKNCAQVLSNGLAVIVAKSFEPLYGHGKVYISAGRNPEMPFHIPE